LLFLLAALGWGQEGLSAEAWRRHFEHDLMRFWSMPDALGTPAGNFPTTRCNDGRNLDFARPCPEIAGNFWLLTPERYLVAQSRQTYAYCLAFHMSGEARYWNWCKAGADFIRRSWIQPDSRVVFTRQDLRTGAWGPRIEFRNAQELAYGLLGLSMYYFVSRDAAALDDILSTKDFILGRLYDPVANTINWQLDSNGAERWDSQRFVAQLDQMNAYLVLLAPILPERYRAETLNSLTVIARLMIEKYYSAEDNLFTLELGARGARDFGHTIKAMWMIRFTGLLTGDRDLVEFAESNGVRVLQRAFDATLGAWDNEVRADGTIGKDKSWWIYAELDQFAATMARQRPELWPLLDRTNAYWLERFVEPQFGEVWSEINAATGRPQGLGKQWPWKNGYHSTEHAFVGWLMASQRAGQPATVYFAFAPSESDGRQARPYFYQGDIAAAEASPVAGLGERWAVTFQNIR
jgi:mannose/cellobiose epimerase-like protein (N-acyl-D-glucosamine 2-epimerase family)